MIDRVRGWRARCPFAPRSLRDQAGWHAVARLSPAAAYGSQLLLHATPRSACHPDPARELARGEKGRANTAIEQVIAKALGVPKSAVSVEKGETQRIKTVRISADPSIAGALEALTGARK